MTTARENAAKAMENFGLTVTSVFVPYSQSRNAAKGWRSLNWKVTLVRNGREILTIDYSAGEGHCPAYKSPSKFPGKDKIDRHATDVRIKNECETGRADRGAFSKPGEKIEPDACDVLYSLLMDSSGVENAGSFEAWASEYGYDTDSRKAEAIYRECVDLALKLRASLGGDMLDSLREAFQDY